MVALRYSPCGRALLRLAIASNPYGDDIFCLFKAKTHEVARLLFSVPQAQLHSKNKVFSSHLHLFHEVLLVKSFASLSCENDHIRE